ncbi:MAG: hypothetical protein RLZZ507_4377 [Cyanobacteriota bacterium]|jgi:hypothetical protein
MTAKIAGADLTTFSALNSLEQQLMFLAGMLLTEQNSYNVANPTAPRNVVAIAPAYATRTATLQCQFTIESDSVLQSLHENITPAF